MKATSIALDLAKGERAYVVPAVVGERRANRVEALVLDHGLPADLTGCDVMFECMGDGWHAVVLKADGRHIQELELTHS